MDARHAGAGSPRLVERARVADRQRSTLARCAALVLAALAVATLALAARADAYVYWTNYDPGTIGRANLDGTGVDQSFITGLGTFPLGVGVDDAHAYWTYGTLTRSGARTSTARASTRVSSRRRPHGAARSRSTAPTSTG
jgi:hypothetical protein